MVVEMDLSNCYYQTMSASMFSSARVSYVPSGGPMSFLRFNLLILLKCTDIFS